MLRPRRFARTFTYSTPRKLQLSASRSGRPGFKRHSGNGNQRLNVANQNAPSFSAESKTIITTTARFITQSISHAIYWLQPVHSNSQNSVHNPAQTLHLQPSISAQISLHQYDKKEVQSTYVIPRLLIAFLIGTGNCTSKA